MDAESFLQDPAKLGIKPDALEALRIRAKKEVDDGLLPSVQIALARHGKLAHFETFGEASNNNLFCIFSATKAITAAAAWLLIQEGTLDISRRVAEIIPEFAANDKSGITIEQVFLHTAGFPHAPFRITDWLDQSKRQQRYAQWRLNWTPGTRYEYHASSSMWIIAELIERISGNTYESFIRDRIATPLGLDDLWVGIGESWHHRIAEIRHVGEPMTDQDYADIGMPVPPATEVTPEAISNFNKSIYRTTPVPGGGGVTTAASLALFYQGLMGQLPEKPWQASTIEFATKPRTGELIDMLTGSPVNRALGVIVAGDEKRNHRGFGHTNSATAFGHKGAGGQIGWFDPDTGISFAYITNGHDRNTIREARRAISVSNRAAVCAG